MRRLLTQFSFFVALLVLAVLGLSGTSFVAAQDAAPISLDGVVSEADSRLRRASVSDTLRSSPIMFVENVGQFEDAARFQVRGATGTMWLAEDGLWMSVLEAQDGAVQDKDKDQERLRGSTPVPELVEGQDTPREGVHLKVSFVGANSAPRIEPFERLDTHVSYFMGNDAEQWQSDIPVWGGVRYKNLYPGIDLELTSQDGQYVQRLVVANEAALEAVRLRVEGADEVQLLPSLSKNGRQGTSGALLSTAIGEMTLPLLHVVTPDGASLELSREPQVNGSEIRAPFAPDIALNQSDLSSRASRSALNYSTFLGGEGSEDDLTLVVDGSGNAYVAGTTTSTNFPTTAGAFDSDYNGVQDLFVAKLNPSGSALLYATFLGGSQADDGFANNLAVDSAGHAYIAGYTSSADFPVTGGAYDQEYNGGDNDSFVAKLNPEGTGLVYATFLGGSGSDPFPRLTIDDTGEAYVTGRTTSTDFPTTNGALDDSHNGDHDAFVVKLNSAGSALVYATLFGGSGYDAAHDIGVLNGEAFVVGAAGDGFPTTADSFDPTFNRCVQDTLRCDAFVAKLNTSGSALVYATYLGGSDSDWFNDLVLSSDGAVSVIGTTYSNDFPMYPDTFDATFNGTVDTVVAKISPTGRSLHFSTYFGGANGDYGNEIVLDSDGSLVIAGGTLSSDMPITSDAMKSSLEGEEDAYIARLRADGRVLLYSSFLGGNGLDWALGLDQDGSGAFYLTGYTDSADFPTTPGALDTSYDSPHDAFVSKLTLDNDSPPPPPPPSTDIDGDGLPNDSETSGWSNGAGTFTTDPNDPDSDDDGLLDGGEKQFDSHPNDDKSPGIYVVYENHFKTQEYFGWNQHGNGYIALESAIIRRGNTFSVGGPAGATIQVSKSMPSLSDLTPVRNANTNRWEIAIGPNNTVGQYTITLTEGAWSKSLTLNVIFEMPADLDESHLDAYLYNDDRNDQKDETSVWFATVEVDNAPPAERHTAYGYSLWFYNEQYQDYVFEHVIATINGSTSQEQAIEQLAQRIDQLTRFDPTYFYFSMYDVLHSYEDRNQCSNIAAALTSFSRSAGIPARPVAVDWDRHVLGGDYFDTATEVWLSGQWKTMRGYNVFTGGEDAPNPIEGGIVSAIDRRSWGNIHYPDSISDVVVVAGPNWVEGDVISNEIFQDYEWDNADPNNIKKWEWVQTVHIPYWGSETWASEPARIADPVIAAAAANLPQSRNTSPDLDSQREGLPVSFTGNNTSDSGVDGDDNDGLFDYLALDVELNVQTAGTYTIIGSLGDSSQGVLLSKRGAIATSKVRAELSEGLQTVELLFDGTQLFMNGKDGPYQVQELIITSLENPTPEDLQNNIIDSFDGTYNTAAYDYTQFETPGANLTGEYNHFGEDTDSNNQYDYLTVEVGLAISTAGTYTVTGDLYDGSDNRANHLASATWSGTETPARLQFDGPSIYRSATDGPYHLRNVRLENSAGQIIGSVDRPGQTYEYSYASFEGPAVLITDVYADSGEDRNSNNLYEYLLIDIEINVSQTGEYTIEGWLSDKENHPVTWATTGRVTLKPGKQSVQLKFDGEAIRANQVNGRFWLSGLKVLESTQKVLLDQRAQATRTGDYDYQVFEADTDYKIYLPLAVR